MGERSIGLQRDKPSYVSCADRQEELQPSASFTRGLVAAVSAFTFHFNLGCCYREISKALQMEGEREQTVETASASSRPSSPYLFSIVLHLRCFSLLPSFLL